MLLAMIIQHSTRSVQPPPEHVKGMLLPLVEHLRDFKDDEKESKEFVNQLIEILQDMLEQEFSLEGVGFKVGEFH
jgi:hypothetical protein